MITASCHCGAVRISVPRLPETITDCNCSICQRYGTLWAYYTIDEVRVEAALGATQAYAWGDKSLQFIRCRHCGCVTHWEPIVADRGPRMGVNARNFDPAEIRDIRIRHLDGAVTERYLD